ncbi:DUF3899 domain-containing protein [Litchfieldia salsa]|uniref:DUF3899 domain-containing protein n=1 Tax=Litchfieldia salsa TaxID=930152 RepID=A0A1H0S5S6_9BACI|nr:DUF3899 domain-containing protein [Litchfieldia salsa]SDP37007.1 protein of unknown function [Litchfieldia salsa]
MINKLLKPLTYTVITIILVLVLSLFIYQQISLLHFINITFIFSSCFILLSLLIFISKAGFFDGITFAFRKFYKNTVKIKELEEDVEQMRLPSEQTTKVSISSFLMTGIILLILMMIALLIY